MSPSQFYDDISEYYDLIYSDWERSMTRQGEAIDSVLQGLASPESRESFRILDVSAGIGTQTLPLSILGYEMTARDLSSRAISRLSREAATRGLSIDAAQADMRCVSDSVEGRFDAILALDNSIPHIQNDAEIGSTFSDFIDLLVPGGVLVLSVRDYEKVDRAPTSSHPYGERIRDDRLYRLGQTWTWSDPAHYQITMVVEKHSDDAWEEIIRTDATYYAIPVFKLLELMANAGFLSWRSDEESYFQPLLVGQRAAQD